MSFVCISQSTFCWHLSNLLLCMNCGGEVARMLGIFEECFESPVKVGLIMLVAFVAGGLVPILPFVLLLASQSSLIVASIATFVSLFLVGVWKTTVTNKHWLPSGLEMVFVGILAAVIPYLNGDFYHRYYRSFYIRSLKQMIIVSR